MDRRPTRTRPTRTRGKLSRRSKRCACGTRRAKREREPSRSEISDLIFTGVGVLSKARAENYDSRSSLSPPYPASTHLHVTRARRAARRRVSDRV